MIENGQLKCSLLAKSWNCAGATALMLLVLYGHIFFCQEGFVKLIPLSKFERNGFESYLAIYGICADSRQ